MFSAKTKRVITSCLIISFISTLFFFALHPQIFLHPFNFLPQSIDSLHLTYVINQIQLNFTNQKSLFWGSFYFPYSKTLTFSNPLFTSALLTYPARLFTNSPILIYNLAFFQSFLFTALAAYFLINSLIQDNLFSVLGSLIFTFVGLRLRFMAHINIFYCFFIPLSLFFWIKFLKTSSQSLFLLFLLSLTAQLFQAPLGSYMIVFAALILWWLGKSSPKFSRQHFLLLLPFLFFWLIFYYPFFQTRLSLGSQASIRTVAHFALSPLRLFVPSSSLVFFALLTIFAFSQIKLFAKNLPWWLIFAFSLVLSLGPVLKIYQQTVKILGLPIPLPYGLLYYLVPGFKVFRTPSRWLILTSLSGSVLIARYLKSTFSHLAFWGKALLASIIFFLVWVENSPPRLARSLTLKPPPVYDQVRDLPDDAAIIELPIKLWPQEYLEYQRSIYSLYHQKRRFNGISSFSPPQWVSLVQNLQKQGLSPSLVGKLRQLGVTHQVVDNKLEPLP